MTESQSPSVYLDDPHVDNWFWEYQEEEDEWRFFADDYEPVVSVKVSRWNGSPLPCFLRGTTMPKGVREVMLRSGMTLFKKSDAGITRVTVDKTIVTKMAEEILAMMEWMKTHD